jgi:hypothetical protein
MAAKDAFNNITDGKFHLVLEDIASAANTT